MNVISNKELGYPFFFKEKLYLPIRRDDNRKGEESKFSAFHGSFHSLLCVQR